MIKLSNWNLKLLLIILTQCSYIVQHSMSAELTDQLNYYGSYDHIYPSVDVAQNQLNCSVTENGTCPLYIALIVSFGGDYDSSGVIPGVQIAIDQINSDPTMLPGYTLYYTCLLYTSPSPRDATLSRMPSSA